MTIRYANGGAATAHPGLAYDGGAWSTVSYPPTGSWGSFARRWPPPVTLKQAANVIRLAKGSPDFAGGTGLRGTGLHHPGCRAEVNWPAAAVGHTGQQEWRGGDRRAGACGSPGPLLPRRPRVPGDIPPLRGSGPGRRSLHQAVMADRRRSRGPRRGHGLRSLWAAIEASPRCAPPRRRGLGSMRAARRGSRPRRQPPQTSAALDVQAPQASAMPLGQVKVAGDRRAKSSPAAVSPPRP